ncbi:MAG: SulP family inorganic anion transporter [Microbacteriaceae bacterium]|jgi:SulP family sulfate permease|nr:SulP family inorganic anion transporter [Microbacteriaceae bacterium]HPZ35151.1 SulP family inorganic anion transporter [Microbacteriaceae bacterium]HQC92284.1 SulP family inorganic anion transporter [Microbacteriaceae bacterium]
MMPTRERVRVGAFLRTLLPSIRDYRDVPRTWRGDLVGGVTVGIVALPLALGFGVSSGVGAEAGLITAIVAGLIAAIFGGSNVQVSGPTGAMVVVLLPIVAMHGVAAIAVVSLMAGALVLLAGLLRLGRSVSFIPWPVIEGFTLGIAVIIFMQQVPSLTSPEPLDPSTTSANAVVAAVEAVAAADWSYLAWAAGAALIVIACMQLSQRIHPAIPGSLVGILVVTVLSLLLSNPLAVIGVLPNSLPMPSIPTIDPGMLPGLVGPAITVAALAAIESLLSARVASSLDATGPYDADRELVGQGLASIGSGLFGGMPATGAIARTAVNVRSGGRTRLASILHAVVLLLVVLLFAGPVGMIPLAALAGVLMLTAWRMVHRATVRSILRSTRADATAFVVTAIVTVSVDLIVAVLIGVAFAGLVAIRQLSRRADVRQETIAGEAAPGDEQIAIVRFDGPLMFATADRVFEEVTKVRGATVVILRMSQLEHVDATGAHILADIVLALERRGITVLIKGVQPAHEGLFRTVGVLASLRDQRHLFSELDAAVEHARDHVRRLAAG